MADKFTIRKVREGAGLSREEAVERLRAHGIKLSVSGLRLYERGEGGSEEKAARIAQILGAPVARSLSGIPADTAETFVRMLDEMEPELSHSVRLWAYALADRLSRADPVHGDLYEAVKKRMLERDESGE